MAIYTSRLLDSNVRMDSRKRQYIQLLVREKDPSLSRLFSEIFDGYYDEHDDYLDPREIDKLIKVAKVNGALGAKFTGGGRGGCIIAIAKNQTDAKLISDKLIDAGATATWVQPLNTIGVNHD